MEFAVKTGLLAPQFAINLWNRVIDSPLQTTAYFLGFRKFAELLEAETKRLGDGFRILNLATMLSKQEPFQSMSCPRF
jgi:hypothetical protein